MTMDRKTFIARLRQLEMADRNAFAVYKELSNLLADDIERKLFSDIAQDEQRHIALNEEIISLLEE